MPQQYTPKHKWCYLTEYERRNLSSIRSHELRAERRRKKSSEEDARCKLLAECGVEIVNGRFRMGEFDLPYLLEVIGYLEYLCQDMRVEPIDMSWLDARMKELTDDINVYRP